MNAWIQSLIDQAVSSISQLAHSTASRLASVWSVITGFFASVGRAESAMRAAVGNWVSTQLSHARAVAITLQWLALTFVPREIGKAASEVRTWTAYLVNLEITGVRVIVADVKAETEYLYRKATGLLSALLAWTLSAVAALASRASTLEGRVFGVLATPERIAVWIVSAMARQLIRFFLANDEAILSYVWARRRTVMLTSEHVIAETLSRLI